MNTIRKPIKTFFQIFILLSPLFAFAQESDESNNSNNTLDEIGMKNSVKWNVGLISRGTFLLNYERALLSWVSLEVGAGITYTDPLYNFVQKVKDEPLYFVEDESTSIEYGYAPAYDFRIRLYPGKMDNMEGFYLGAGIHGRHFNSTTIIKATEDIEETSHKTSYSMLDGHIIFGLQREAKSIEGLLIDTYCGIGIRNKSRAYYSDETNDIKNDSKSNPVVILGVKIGLPF